MPRISYFYGIAITMNYGDHNPPHIHVAYGGRRCRMSIRESAVMDGWITPRSLRLAAEWIDLHRPELLDDWARAQSLEPVLPLDPLP